MKRKCCDNNSYTIQQGVKLAAPVPDASNAGHAHPSTVNGKNITKRHMKAT